MRNALFAGLLALIMAMPAFANGDGPRGFCNGPGDDCNNTTTTNHGGNAYSSSGSSVYSPDYSFDYNPSSSSSHSGASIYAPDYSSEFEYESTEIDLTSEVEVNNDVHQSQLGINSQDQEQYQGNLGVVKNVGPQVTVEDNRQTTVEAPRAVSDISLSQAGPTAACLKTWSGGGTVGAGISAGLGASGTTRDNVCTANQQSLMALQRGDIEMGHFWARAADCIAAAELDMYAPYCDAYEAEQREFAQAEDYRKAVEARGADRAHR